MGLRVACAGLLLDMDGVLVDSGSSIERVWTAWALEHALDPVAVIACSHGVPERFVVERYLGHADPAMVDALSARFGERAPDPVPGALDLLSSLAAPWAVVTSARRSVAVASLRSAGLPEPPHLVSADDVARGKPDPEPYLAGARRIQVEASRCLALEDSPAGVRSAVAAGCTVVGVSTTHGAESLTAAGARAVVPDLRAVSWSRGRVALRG